MNSQLHPVMTQALAPFAPRGSEAYAQRRADYFDECRLGMDCGPDDQDRDPDGDEDDFEGAPVCGMNTRRYSRSMREAFPFGPEYGAAIERPRAYPRTLWITMAAAVVYLAGLLILELV